MSEEEPQPPRFQDTTERAALPLPLPGNPDGDEESPQAAAEEPVAPPAGDSATEEAPALDPLFAPPAAEPYPPADDGPSPEILVGAAFLGGVALALLIRRLGS